MEGRAVFLRSDRDRLGSAPFLDGRTAVSTEPEVKLPLSALETPDANPPRLIMHMSFCGSTQLAQLVDAAGAGLVLKEPQALVDLADWQRSLVEQQLSDERFGPALEAAAGLLSRRWNGAPPTVLKPSNWANNLLPDLLRIDGARAVLVTIEARPFLRAVFRGGRDRLSFTARAAQHLAAATGQASLVRAAISETDDPLDRAARLALVTHEVQRRLFAAAACPSVDYSQIASNAADALRTAAGALGLSLSDEAAAQAVQTRASTDAKEPSRSFSSAAQDLEDAEVERHHGERLDRALDWAAKTFSP